LENLREKANGLPLLPGVYIMMDKTGQVIYVGKAKALKNRVSSYFHGSHGPKTELMISKIARFDVIVANLTSGLLKTILPSLRGLFRCGGAGRAVGGKLILSGLLVSEEEAMTHAIRAAGFDGVTAVTKGEWLLLCADCC
jgi:ribosomal protein L11 methylase PrmA